MEVDYLLVIRLWIFLCTFVLSYSQEECKKGGCFPATGDLLVGRQNKLKATSVCGLKGPERYCIVSFLDKKNKCFYCDSRYEVDSLSSNTNFHNTSHLVKYAVSSSPKERLHGWWQSENGVQQVTMQLDLEVEFVFTHLIMTFKTFRPKAMYVERSWNYGREWSIYRYYAFNCTKSFPGIPKGPQKKIDDIICEERYSRVEPSTEGEVVMKVLDPVIQKNEDPYSQRVQNLLKLTNLRIRFKELHTFGDDVLGDSPEVNRKYYYALYEMVVRGSCSCYGHAEQCIPQGGGALIHNMVYGNCDCKHFTTGRNCERCMAGYNDEPWRPAYKEQLNVCRKCKCHGHTKKCHFDPAVYNATGHTSGGVCDDCQHNTAGRECEHCRPLYYRDPFKDITDTNVCRPCDCDPAGSFGGGECETENVSPADAGRCICKSNVVGKRCATCKDGFWNLLESNPKGCQSCKCDSRGTVERDTCEQKSGVCRCKRNVKGLTCSQCLDGYWNLGATPKGCESCGCDPGGARNFTCDDVSGQCSCRAHIMGRKCDRMRPGYYFANLDQNTYEAENAIPDVGTPFEVVRKVVSGKDRRPGWTGNGYLKVKKGSAINFPTLRVPKTGDYNLVLRYDTLNAGDWTDVRVTIQKAYGGPMGGDGCPEDSSEAIYRYPILRADQKALEIEPAVCLQKGVPYKVTIDFRSNSGGGDGSTLLDSVVLMPKVDNLSLFDGRTNAEAAQRKKIYEEKKCRKYYVTANTAKDVPEVCKKIQFSISAIINDGGLSCQCHPIGSSSNTSSVVTCEEAGGQCPCKPGVTGRTCDKTAPGFFGFGGHGAPMCACNPVGATSEFCHSITGKCSCLPQIEGRMCDSCPPFHYGFPNCKICNCNKHSQVCDPENGKCTGCRHNTAGPNCDVCAVGYYGDAMQGTESDCQRCQCPGGSSGNQFSTTCILDPSGRGICNNCTIGYHGNQCEKCIDGYYGNPLKAGGSCKKCDCSGNIAPQAVGKCDAVAGKCFNCINNATGDQCGKCKPKFFGYARNQTCRECVCNVLGTDPTKGGICNPISGQCPCLKDVEGKECGRCAAGFYGIATGRGCLECKCRKRGSLEGSCDQVSGQCKCRVGFGGRDCGECENLYWGHPLKHTCKACGCNPKGSLTQQCHRNTGKCKCKNNVIGEKCDMCAPRTAGAMPKCESCHTCNGQWEDIASELEENLKVMINVSANITVNTTGIMLYTDEIKGLKKMLKGVQAMFKEHLVDSSKVDNFNADMRSFRSKLHNITQQINNFTQMVHNTSTRNANANRQLKNLDSILIYIQTKAKEFKINVTKVVEGNIGGALNSTKDSLKRSSAAKLLIDNSKTIIPKSKRMRKKLKKEIITGKVPFDKLYKDSGQRTEHFAIDVTDLQKKLKELNGMLCGKGCGGCTKDACKTCGVTMNCKGVRKMANDALAKAKEALGLLKDKKVNATTLVETVKNVEKQVNETRTATKEAEKTAHEAKTKGEETKKKIIKLMKDVKDFLNVIFNDPKKSRQLAKETLALNISLTPQEVRALAEKIKKAVKDLTVVNKILTESKSDLDAALSLKKEALEAKKFAIEVMNKTQKILDMLSTTKELQKKTEHSINATKKVIDETTDVIKQIKEKLGNAVRNLTSARQDVGRVTAKTQNVKDEFELNKNNLKLAEDKYKEAKKKVKVVDTTSRVLNIKYNNTQKKVKEKKEILNSVLKRIMALSQGATEATINVEKKTSVLTELTKKYKSNEKSANDLSAQLKRLTIKAKYTRDRLKELSACHSTCNPALTGNICTTQLKNLENKEKLEYAALQ